MHFHTYSYIAAVINAIDQITNITCIYSDQPTENHHLTLQDASAPHNLSNNPFSNGFSSNNLNGVVNSHSSNKCNFKMQQLASEINSLSLLPSTEQQTDAANSQLGKGI